MIAGKSSMFETWLWWLATSNGGLRNSLLEFGGPQGLVSLTLEFCPDDGL